MMQNQAYEGLELLPDQYSDEGFEDCGTERVQSL